MNTIQETAVIYALTTLYLSSNNIEEEREKGIASENFSALRSLNLYNNSIGGEEKEALKKIGLEDLKF